MAVDEKRVTVKGRYVGGGLFEPRADKQNPDKAPKFSACIVLDKGQEKLVQSCIDAAVAEKFGSKPPAGLQDWGVRKGDDPEYEASYEKSFINPKSQRLVKVMRKSADGTYETVTQEDDVVYPGCDVAVSISAYAYEGDRKAGVKPGATLNLRGMLFVRDNDRLDDFMDAEAEFDDIEVEVADEEDDDFLAA